MVCGSVEGHALSSGALSQAKKLLRPAAPGTMRGGTGTKASPQTNEGKQLCAE